MDSRIMYLLLVSLVLAVTTASKKSKYSTEDLTLVPFPREDCYRKGSVMRRIALAWRDQKGLSEQHKVLACLFRREQLEGKVLVPPWMRHEYQEEQRKKTAVVKTTTTTTEIPTWRRKKGQSVTERKAQKSEKMLCKVCFGLVY